MIVQIIENRLFLCVTAVMLLCAVGAYAEVPGNSFRVLSLHEKKIIAEAVSGYSAKILELNQDILNMKKKQEWLHVKIHNIQDQERRVPNELSWADLNMKQKIMFTGKEVARLSDLTKRHIIALVDLDKKVKKTNNGKAPEWWSVEQWLLDLMYPGRARAVKASAEITGSGIPKASLHPEDKSSLITSIKEKIDAAGLENWVELFTDEKIPRLEVQLPILFGSGKANVAKDYKRFFRKLSRLLKPYQVQVEVAGFTDSKAVKGGKYSSNLELGASRATNVVKELISTGMDQSIFKITSQAEKSEKTSGQKSGNLSAAMKRRVEVNVFFKNSGA